MDRVRRQGKFEDKYQLGRELGKGAFAVVNLCHEKTNNAQFAVKIIQKGSSPTQKETVETEVKIMATLSHQNIVRLLDLYETPTEYYLVMELITGGELFDKIIEIQSYSEADASRLIRQILAAVAHCHDNHIVHRDLKPENLLLANKDINSDVKLADFGLSKDLKVTPELFNCAGTPGYIAPEILEAYFEKIPYGKTVDLWSTGVILYILVYGFPPFWEEDQDEMFDKIRKGDYFFPSSIEISDGCKDIITKLLTVDPKKRLTAQEALDHPWVRGDSATNVALSDEFKDSLRKWNLRRKFQRAARAVQAINRMKGALALASANALTTSAAAIAADDAEPTGEPSSAPTSGQRATPKVNANGKPHIKVYMSKSVLPAMVQELTPEQEAEAEKLIKEKHHHRHHKSHKKDGTSKKEKSSSSKKEKSSHKEKKEKSAAAPASPKAAAPAQ